MTEEVPPEGPVAGWYQDPSGDPGYRWWDGSQWTASVAPAEHDPNQPPPPVAGGPNHSLGQAGDWMQETIRSVVGRAGHYLPMVLILALPLGIASAVPMWFGLREIILVSDPEAQTFELQNFEWSPAIFGLIALNVVSILTGFIMAGAAAHQALPSICLLYTSPSPRDS